MSTSSDPPDVTEISSAQLHNALFAAGWQLGGGREGLYERWRAASGTEENAILVPLDRGRADYHELLFDAIAQLRGLARFDERARLVITRLSRAPGDEILFRKDALTVRGAVAWPTGEDLIVSARLSLIAAAKARLSRRAYFGQKSGQFAKRFLESVLMGQTQVGSYIVSAYAPVDEVFLERPGTDSNESSRRLFVGADAGYSGREITQSLSDALEGLTVAADHYKHSASLSGFDDAIQKGVSRELSDAVKGMVSGSREATVKISFTDAGQQVFPVSPEPVPMLTREFTFEGSLYPILERASNHLKTLAPDEFVTATGWANTVSRPTRKNTGVVRLRVLRGSSARTIAVRLSEEQWHLAAASIASDEILLTVAGRQVKEGNRHWLYDVTEVLAREEPRLRLKAPETTPMTFGED